MCTDGHRQLQEVWTFQVGMEQRIITQKPLNLKENSLNVDIYISHDLV